MNDLSPSGLVIGSKKDDSVRKSLKLVTASKIATLVSAVFVLWHHSLSQKAHTRPIQNKRDELVVWIVVMLIWPHIWEWMAIGCWGGASVGLACPYAVMMYNLR